MRKHKFYFILIIVKFIYNNKDVKMKKNILFFIITIILFNQIAFAQVTITLPNATGSPNSESLFPVTVSNLTGQNVTSFQFQINYNKSAIYITDLSISGTILAGSSPTTKVDTGKGYFRIAWASAYPLSGSGTLFNIKIKFRNSGSTNLEFGDIVYDNGNVNPKMFGPQTLQVTWQNGTATVSTSNNPPVFTPIEDKSVNEGDTLTFTINATDPENNPLTYDIQNKPNGADFNPLTRTFTWVPNFNQQGNYEVTFTANDGVNIATLNVNITVVNVNRPPTLNLNTQSPVNIKEGENYTLQLTATDPDSGAILSFTGTNLPQGADITADGLFTWKPNYNQAGSYLITFMVLDEFNATDTKTLLINVQDANQPPIFTKSMPAQIVTVHNVPVEFSFQYEAVDPEGDPITFAAVEVPQNAGITSSGLFTWTPTVDQANKTFRIIIAAFDTYSFSYDTTSLTTSHVVSVEDTKIIPNKFELYQNFPNPFNPTTTIQFALPKESYVSLKVYNIMGEEVVSLINKVMPAGYHNIVFDASKLVAGLYFYKIETDNYSVVKKMILLK